MTKTVFRYFFDFADKQERWLNEKAGDGFRLIGAGKVAYEFEDCERGKYEYRVEFAADKTNAEIQEYKAFLEGFGYRVFHKNVNLNLSLGKTRWRPLRSGFATSPGSYNRELLIVERESDGKPFELHTGAKDLAAYFGGVRNMFVPVAILGIAFALIAAWRALNAADPSFAQGLSVGLMGAVGVCAAFLSAKYALIARRYASQ